MKLLSLIIILAVSFQARAVDQNLLTFRDWQTDQLDEHKVSTKGACVSKTVLDDKDTSLEVYAEANEQGGYVEPVVQIISTDLPPALAVVFRPLPGNQDFPMTISLKETREIEVPVTQNGVTTFETKEQQVFIGRFNNKEEMIQLIRAKNQVRAKFFDASGEVAQEVFSLRGSSRNVRKLVSDCL